MLPTAVQQDRLPLSHVTDSMGPQQGTWTEVLAKAHPHPTPCLSLFYEKV